jgi:hypothetical protein
MSRAKNWFQIPINLREMQFQPTWVLLSVVSALFLSTLGLLISLTDSDNFSDILTLTTVEMVKPDTFHPPVVMNIPLSLEYCN